MKNFKIVIAVSVILCLFLIGLLYNSNKSPMQNIATETYEEKEAKEKDILANHISELESKTNSTFFDYNKFIEKTKYSSELEKTILNKRILVSFNYIDDIKVINKSYVGYFSNYNYVCALKLNENLYNEILKFNEYKESYLVVNVISLYKNIFEINPYIDKEDDTPLAKWNIQDTSMGDIKFYGELLEIAEFNKVEDKIND